MSADPSVIAALRASLEADPSNVPVRLHLAGLLLEAGEATDALANCQQILATNPDHKDAIELAAKAADAAGDPIKAAGYKKLRDALGWNTTESMMKGLEDPDPESAPEDTPRERVPVGPGPSASSEEDDGFFLEFEPPSLTLDDVAGMQNVKKRLNVAFLAPLKNPDLRDMYKKSLRGGLLLYGPPGCGKTYIAKAVAGEMGAQFVTVGLTDVLDMWIGESERKLHELFDFARRKTPCVLFLDEIDALGRKRSLMRHHAGTNVVNQLLSELDGMNNDNDDLYVLAATNHPWDVDSALRRPGRFDRTIFVTPPDKEARAHIVQMQLEGRPHEGIDTAWIGAKSEDFSGADIAHLVEVSAESAMEDSIESGIPRAIQMRDFKSALKEVRSSTRPWFETAKNHALYANDGGQYDDLLEYLKGRRLL